MTSHRYNCQRHIGRRHHRNDLTPVYVGERLGGNHGNQQGGGITRNSSFADYQLPSPATSLFMQHHTPMRGFFPNPMLQNNNMGNNMLGGNMGNPLIFAPNFSNNADSLRAFMFARMGNSQQGQNPQQAPAIGQALDAAVKRENPS